MFKKQENGLILSSCGNIDNEGKANNLKKYVHTNCNR